MGPDAAPCLCGFLNFNPPTPWGVGLSHSIALPFSSVFQSTHSVGSGTFPCVPPPCSRYYFNPPTPWGVGPDKVILTPTCSDFNPPTPWGVGLYRFARSPVHLDFNPPTPWGVGLLCYPALVVVVNFNPPTPWGVGHTPLTFSAISSDFNPPTPWGVGRIINPLPRQQKKFQSTHSVGSGTQALPHGFALAVISIHPLRGEWDAYTHDLSALR